jgi:hypothetical protein
MQVNKTPDEVIITIPGTLDENDLMEVITLLRHKVQRRKRGDFLANQKRISSADYNWWKENQLLL